MPMLWSGIVQHGPITFDLKNGCGVTGPWPTVADFNGGKSAIGTGPYTLKSMSGQRHRTDPQRRLLGRQTGLGRGQADPRAVGRSAPDGPVGRRLRPDREPAARDVKRISETPGFGYVITPSVRVVYFQFDVARSPAHGQAADGKTRCRTCACAAPFPWPSTARPSPPASWTAPPPRPTSSCPTACSARCRSRRNSSTTPKAPEAAGRGRLPERLRTGRVIHQRPLHQRRPDLAGGGAVPVARGHQGLGRRDDALDLLPQARQARVQLRHGRLVVGNGRSLVFPAILGLRVRQGTRPGHQQLRRLRQPGVRPGLQARPGHGGPGRARSCCRNRWRSRWRTCPASRCTSKAASGRTARA